jgi:hypothetical protein
VTGPERGADADRERAVAALRDHAVAGRLTLEELADRVGSALAATTHGDLDATLAGAPVVHLRARTAFGSLTVRRG